MYRKNLREVLSDLSCYVLKPLHGFVMHCLPSKFDYGGVECILRSVGERGEQWIYNMEYFVYSELEASEMGKRRQVLYDRRVKLM